ncbi:hypothetical protein BGZ58_000276 [Dissophora ornata]|nr:hypothetical protein BGZ58_000276 [Dissophora ornata]
MSLSAAILQSRKLWTSSHCRIIPLEHRQFCETAKAVLVTYLTASVWMLWAVWCFFKTVYKAGGAHGAGDMDTEAQQQQQRGMQEEGENGRREGDVLIPIPGSYSGGTADMKIVVAGAASVGAGIAESSMQGHSHQQNHQQHQQAQQNLPQSKNLQQTSVTNTVASAENGKNLTDPGSVSSLGLGIDMLPPKTDNHTTLDKMHPNSVSLNGVNDADKNTTNSNSDPTRSYSKINCIGSSSTGNITHSRSTAIVAQNTVAAFVQPAGDRSRSNSNGSFMSSSNNGNAINVARLRDHAKVFDIPRSRSGSIHEAAYHSSRDTPPSHSNARDKFPVPATPSNNQSVDFSPSISTPDTPLTRGEIGYMGVHTAKVFNSNGGIPGTGSMGHVAAFNNGGPGGPSAQSSPQAGPLDTVRTPSSARSYGSMSSFFGPGSALPSGGGANYPQTPAEVEAAEQSMDEYLKAVRRRSFATNSLLMNSEGPTSFTTAAMFGVGASPSPTTPTRGAFRTSLSSPNLNTTRRRSSLMSVLSSIVSTPVDPSSSSISSCSTSSDLSSPRSITSPICDDAEEADDVTAFEGQKKRPQSVSAQDLLRAEYGDLYCGVTDRNGKHVMEPEQPNSNGFTPVPAPSRSRSSSVSSNRTSSSGSSESSSSTTSNTTSLSNDEKPATTNNITRPTSVTSGPPLTFRNKTLVGSYRSTDVNQMRHHHSQRQQQNHQKQGVLRRAGSSGNFKKDVTGMQRSGSMTSSLKNFPSQGGLTEQFII